MYDGKSGELQAGKLRKSQIRYFMTFLLGRYDGEIPNQDWKKSRSSVITLSAEVIKSGFVEVCLTFQSGAAGLVADGERGNKTDRFPPPLT